MFTHTITEPHWSREARRLPPKPREYRIWADYDYVYREHYRYQLEGGPKSKPFFDLEACKREALRAATAPVALSNAEAEADEKLWQQIKAEMPANRH